MVYLGEKIAKDYISHLRKGDVLLWECFDLEKKRKDSRFIILTEQNELGRFFAIRASSSELAIRLYYQRKEEKIWIDQNKEKTLPKTTTLDFARATCVLDEQNMIKLCGQGLKRIGRLSDDLINKIDELVRKTKVIERKWKEKILNSRRSDLEY